MLKTNIRSALAAILLSFIIISCVSLAACSSEKTDNVQTNTQCSTLLDVPYVSQEGWPTGCEAASTTMILNFYGTETSIADVAEAMPKKPITYVNGQTLGPDPDEFFAGSPSDEKSFGCYAGVVEKTMNQLLPESYSAEAIRGYSIAELETFIDHGQPVILWATINMQEPVENAAWIVYGTNDTFTWTSPEHCLVLVGYDETCYYFQDPYDNLGLVKWEKELVASRYEALGQQAVVVFPSD